MCGGCCGQSDSDEKGGLVNPIKNRGCTDIILLLIFIIFWVGMVITAAFSIINGDAFRLVYGYDSFGNTCDEDNSYKRIENVSLSGMNMKGKPYVFFMDITNPVKSLAICVNKCPDDDFKSMADVKTFSRISGSMLCRYDINLTDYETAGTGLRGPCPDVSESNVVPKSEPLLNRCVPSDLTSLGSLVAKEIIEFLNESDIFQKVLSDLYTGWREMLVLCFIALGFSVIMVLLIRYLASFIVWIILTISVLASIAGTAFLWWTYADIRSKVEEDEATEIPLLEVEINGRNAFLVYSIVATVLTVILLLVIIIMRKRIALVVTLFHEAGKCIAGMPCILLQSVWTFIILLIFFAYWVIILAYLSTAETPVVNKYGFVKYEDHKTESYLWWYHLIGLIWTSEFIIACQQLVISGAVATWYFTRDKNELGCPIIKSMGRLIRYHLGSAVFGALIITIVKLPRWILMYLDKKLKSSQNECARFCLKCCICCLWCLEKCLKFLNQNAYTVVAIRGSNFCSSARKAFTILVNNALRVAAINSVGDFILFLGKIGVMAATAAVGIVWLKSRTDLHYFAVPVLLVCVFAYFIAHCFLSTYEMVIDALLLCFCEDCDINDGSAERPYFASESLMKFVEDGSRKLNELTKPAGTGEAEPASV